jgi:hypothetical protein
MTSMDELQHRLAARVLGVTPRVDFRPFGVLVGEAPGPRTSSRLPLFPYPVNSAGGRLLRYSGMEVRDYLARLHRMNLFSELGRWSAPAARERALTCASRIGALGIKRAVLLGAKVAAAFASDFGLWDRATWGPLEVVVIPHPSGQNLIYNDSHEQRRAGVAVRWAAGLRDTLRL